MSTKIVITSEQFTKASIKAAEAQKRYGGDEWAAYHNTFEGQLLGKMGEIGVYQFLIDQGIRGVVPAFESDNRLPDIIIRHTDGRVITIEVKTWTDEYWCTLGRCISERQYEKIKGYDYIVWVTGYPPMVERDSYTFAIEGFSRPIQFADIAPQPTGRSGVVNRQLPMDDLSPILHLVEKLLQWQT